jgi:hypothetical protein
VRINDLLYCAALGWTGWTWFADLIAMAFLFFFYFLLLAGGSVPYELIIMDVLAGGCRSARLL